MAKIDEIEKMLKAVLNTVTGFRQEFLTFKQEVFKKFDEVDKRFDDLEKRLTKRIDGVEDRLDKIGRQLAYLEDDAPTREEFGKLEKRVDKIEQKSPSLA